MGSNPPSVTVQPARGDTDPERFLQAVSDAIERSTVLQRDNVVLSLETPELRTDGGSTAEELPLPGPEEGTEVTAVDSADGERCCFRYPGIKGQCTDDAEVVLTYEGENVYNSPSKAPYCEEHVDLPDWIWERLEEQQLVTDGGQTLGDRLRDAADEIGAVAEEAPGGDFDEEAIDEIEEEWGEAPELPSTLRVLEQLTREMAILAEDHGEKDEQ